MASRTDLINIAAVRLGEARIIDPETDTGETARILNFQYEFSRQDVLHSHTWGSAKEFTTISSDSSDPIFKWGQSYNLPNDYLRAVSLNDVDIDDVWAPRHERVGRKLYADVASPLSLIYIKDLTEVGSMDPMLRQAIALKTAVDSCVARTDWLPLKDSIMAEYEVVLQQARTIDSMENRKPLQNRHRGSAWDAAHFGGEGIE